jgi:transglutaminase-like putative cysteine protease
VSTRVRSFALEIPAEVLLYALTLTAVLGFDRLFADDEYALPLILTATVAHAALAFLRRRGFGILVASAGAGLAVLLANIWIHYGSTTRAGIPTGTTWTSARADLDAAWALFQNVTAPAPSATGFLLAAAIAVWLVAVLADWAAFRLRSSVESVVPTLALIVFVAMFGESRGRLTTTLLYLTALLVFIGTHRAAHQATTGTWLGAAQARHGYRAILTGTAGLALVAIVAGGVIGPAFPGVDDDPIVDWKNIGEGSDDPSRVVISPLVDIRGRLVDQQDVEVFTVRSDQRSYWRLTALDTFDGLVWKSRADYDDASGALPSDFTSGTTVVTSSQEFQIRALSQVWLPAAFEPRTLTNLTDVGVSYEPTSATLIVENGRSTSNGLSYQTTSALPRFDAAVLSTANEPLPAEIAEGFLVLPENFSPTAASLALELTSGLTTPYEKALALQNYFRNGFTYDLDVAAGHSTDTIEEFLTLGRGYCEQFAGTFAAMARAIGLPSRVAVGFTPGDEVEPGLYSVRGEHAHAWPEVFITGAGWVAFEPTPGRGAPGAQNYTGVAEQQDESGPSTTPTTRVEVPDDATATTTPDPGFGDPGESDTNPPGDEVASGADPGPGGGSDALRATLVVLGLIAAVVAALVIGVPAVAGARRRRLVAEVGDDATGRVRLAWNDIASVGRRIGVTPTATETPVEYAGRLGGSLGIDSGATHRLGMAAEMAAFAATAPGEPLVRDAEAARDAITESAEAKISFTHRVRWRMDPRRIFG